MSETLPSAFSEGHLPRSRFFRREPLYAMVEHDLAEAILSGKLKRGAPVPGEVELAAQYGVSVGTVRRALAALVASGFVERRPRHGTVVADRSPHQSLRFLFHYYRLHGEDEALLASVPRTLSLAIVKADAAQIAALNLPADRPEIIRIHRVRTVDDRPAAHDVMMLPAWRFPDFPAIDELPHRMLSLLEDRYGVRFASARESVWADAANEEDHRLLGVTPGAPMLVIDRVTFDKANTPVELATGRFVSKGFRYINEVR